MAKVQCGEVELKGGDATHVVREAFGGDARTPTVGTKTSSTAAAAVSDRRMAAHSLRFKL